MTSIESARNALGTVQKLHTFLEASPKRHRTFQDLEVDHVNPTLKSLSAARWSCRWEAVRAVPEQITRISCSDDHDPKTYTDSNVLLNSICDFAFGLLLLKVVLPNTDSLSKYLQSKNMDVTTAKKTADSTIKTLEGCRDEKCFQMLWVRAQVMANGIKKEVQGTRLSFKDVTAPRNKAPSRRLQAIIEVIHHAQLSINNQLLITGLKPSTQR